jgi:hypothetical protein
MLSEYIISNVYDNNNQFRVNEYHFTTINGIKILEQIEGLDEINLIITNAKNQFIIINNDNTLIPNFTSEIKFVLDKKFENTDQIQRYLENNFSSNCKFIKVLKNYRFYNNVVINSYLMLITGYNSKINYRSLGLNEYLSRIFQLPCGNILKIYFQELLLDYSISSNKKKTKLIQFLKPIFGQKQALIEMFNINIKELI